MELTLCVPCLFGLEGLVGNELRHMGLQNVAPENGRVFFTGNENDIAKVNIRSRFGERVLIVLGRFPAPTFDALFEGTKALPWEQFIPREGAFPVKGWSLESALHSIPDCQKIVKKAVVERLHRIYKLEYFPESGETYQIQFGIMKDQAVLYLDTSGVGLYKRGYRPAQVAAPLRETLAAAMVDITRYRGRGDFADPFCGGGTIAIEAALAAKGRAPGIGRHFAAERWPVFDSAMWKETREECRAKEYHGDYRIFASDIDPKAIEMAKANAARAGVSDIIQFSVGDARRFQTRTESGILCCNPPYGERMMEKNEVALLYKDFGRAMKLNREWKVYVISSDTEFEAHYGRTAVKRRRLYNGMIPCTLYMFD